MGLRRRLVFAGRFVLGSLAGAVFVPVGVDPLAAPAPMSRAVALPAPHPLGALWRFSRPHTIVGTTVSIVALYLIAVDTLPGLALGGGLWDLFWTLVAGLAVNVYIVGVNQLEDVDIDRVNKPFLPLAAGEMSRETARAVVGGDGRAGRRARASPRARWRPSRCSPALVVGTAYSTPPLRLKRFPVAASLCISGVRSVVVNLGVYAHFSLALGDGTVSIPPAVWALTIVVLPFSLAIAILKDVPDAEGDRRFRIMTFTVRVGGQRVLRAGLAMLVLAYVGHGGRGAARDPRGAAGRARRRAPRRARRAARPGRAPPTPTTRPSSRASTCACGSCSSSSTRSSRSPASRASRGGGRRARRSGRRSPRRARRERGARPQQRGQAGGGLLLGLEAAGGRDHVRGGRRERRRGSAGGGRRGGAAPRACSSAAAGAGTGAPTYLRRRGRSSAAPAPSGSTLGDSSCE